MGIVVSSTVTFIVNTLYGIGQCIFDFLLSLPERTRKWLERVGGAIVEAKDALQRTAPAVGKSIDKTREKVSFYVSRAIDIVSFQNGPWIFRLPGRLIRFFAGAINLLVEGFAKSYRFLYFWVGLILIYWFIDWLILPSAVNPTDVVLTVDAIYEGLRAAANGIFSIINLFFDLIDKVKIGINVVFGFVLTIYQYTAEFFLGELTPDRLGNLKSLEKLKTSTNSFANGIQNDNPQFTGTGRRLAQDVFGADATFGGFTLSLATDDAAVNRFARFYSSFFGTIAYVFDVLAFLYEIYLATVAQFFGAILQFWVGIITNFSCVVTASNSARGFGCIVGEFILVFINALIRFFGGKAIKGCSANLLPGVPCYCAKSEGGFLSGLPSCPIPVYACVSRDGVFTETEISSYNGITTEKLLQSGPTREIGCPRSIRSGRLLQIGSDCRDICHLDETGEGWWINTCDETETFMGHCVARYNKTSLTEFDTLDDVHRERHLKRYLKKPWVSIKEKRRLTAFTEPKQEDNFFTMSYLQFSDLISRAYRNIPNVRVLPLDCSEVNPYDSGVIHKILYNTVCVSLSLYDLKNKEKEIFNVGEILTDAYPPLKRPQKPPPRRNLLDSSGSVGSQLEYLHYKLKDDFSWNQIKKLHIEYIDYRYEGEYQSILKNATYRQVLNRTANLMMNIYRASLLKPDDIPRRKLQEQAINLPAGKRLYLCPNGLQRVANKISTNPENPGIESCKIPDKWSTVIILRFISYLLLFTFYTLNPFKWTESITDCWSTYSSNPETYPLTWEGINAMLYNDQNYLSTKTFCFPLVGVIPRIPEIIWSFQVYVEENCGPEYTLATGKLDRCICPQFTISDALDDYSSQWIAFIPLFVKYRLINTYRTLQLVWTLLVPTWISDLWSALFKFIYPPTPDEVLYAFNSGYAQGAAVYWGTRNDLTTEGIFLCVFLTIQSPLYFVIWYILPLFYLSYYYKFIQYLVTGVVNFILYNPIRTFWNYITLQRIIQENPYYSRWRLRIRENPILKGSRFLYARIIMPCLRSVCPRRMTTFWCPPNADWDETTLTMNQNLNSMSDLQTELLILSNGEQVQPISLPNQPILQPNTNLVRRGSLNRVYNV